MESDSVNYKIIHLKSLNQTYMIIENTIELEVENFNQKENILKEIIIKINIEEYIKIKINKDKMQKKNLKEASLNKLKHF